MSTVYVDYASIKGNHKGVDTYDNFMSWSRHPNAAGKFKIVNKYESQTPPDGYKIPQTKEQVRAARLKAKEEAKKARQEAREQRKNPQPHVPTVPTPPEALPGNTNSNDHSNDADDHDLEDDQN